MANGKGSDSYEILEAVGLGKEGRVFMHLSPKPDRYEELRISTDADASLGQATGEVNRVDDEVRPTLRELNEKKLSRNDVVIENNVKEDITKIPLEIANNSQIVNGVDKRRVNMRTPQLSDFRRPQGSAWRLKQERLGPRPPEDKFRPPNRNA